MTRVEAYQALFGADANATASQGAIEMLGDEPSLTEQDEGDLSSNLDILDNASDFVANPKSYADRLAPGPAKDLLVAYATRLKMVSGSSTIDPAATDTQKKPSSDAKSEPSRAGAIDPLAELGVGTSAPPAVSKDADIMPSDRPTSDSTAPSETDSSAQSAVPPPTPKTPSKIPLVLRQAQRNPLLGWSHMRDSIIDAFCASQDPGRKSLGNAALARFRLMSAGFQTGQNGGDMKWIGILMANLLDDLESGLDSSDPTEYQHRYWPPR